METTASASPSDLDVYRLLRDEKWEEFATLVDSGTIDPNKKYTVHGISDMSFYLLLWVVKPETNWLAKKLLERGANPNRERPLIQACWQRNHEAIDMLLNAGANPNVGTETPLMEAAELSDLWAVERLLQAGADPTKVTSAKKRQSAVWFATSTDHRSRAGDRAKIITLLTERGCKLQGNELHWPVHRRDIDLVRLLLSLGCPVNAPVGQGEYREFTKGETPLTLATTSNAEDHVALIRKDEFTQRLKRDIVVNLLAAGANPNVPNSKGQTPILITVLAYYFEKGFETFSGDHLLEIARSLLEAGADPILKLANCKEGSAMEFAEQKNLEPFLRLFNESRT